jgi:hypothetical protein
MKPTPASAVTLLLVIAFKAVIFRASKQSFFKSHFATVIFRAYIAFKAITFLVIILCAVISVADSLRSFLFNRHTNLKHSFMESNLSSAKKKLWVKSLKADICGVIFFKAAIDWNKALISILILWTIAFLEPNQSRAVLPGTNQQSNLG